MLETLTIETFTPRVGDRFRVVLGDATELELTLSDVQALSKHGSIRQRTPFSLLFHAPGPQILPQGIHRLEGEELPALEIFLVPLGPEQRGICYQAIFT